jgi:hypothetical protein
VIGCGTVKFHPAPVSGMTVRLSHPVYGDLSHSNSITQLDRLDLPLRIYRGASGVQSMHRAARSLETPIGREPSWWASTVKFHPASHRMTRDSWHYVCTYILLCMYSMGVGQYQSTRWVCRACWISSYRANPSYNEDDEYHIAKECSRGWRSIGSDE